MVCLQFNFYRLRKCAQALMVSNFQINTSDPNVMCLNRLVNLNKDLFELMKKPARKTVTGILVYDRDIYYLNASDCFPCRLSH